MQTLLALLVKGSERLSLLGKSGKGARALASEWRPHPLLARSSHGGWDGMGSQTAELFRKVALTHAHYGAPDWTKCIRRFWRNRRVGDFFQSRRLQLLCGCTSTHSDGWNGFPGCKYICICSRSIFSSLEEYFVVHLHLTFRRWNRKLPTFVHMQLFALGFSSIFHCVMEVVPW
jgi:hypothetical protein